LLSPFKRKSALHDVSVAKPSHLPSNNGEIVLEGLDERLVHARSVYFTPSATPPSLVLPCGVCGVRG
jgi:hypothetical protein